MSQKIFPILFADDSNMFLSGRNCDDLINVMNEEMVKIVDWLNANKLSLNLKKTHFMIFRRKRGKVTISNPLIVTMFRSKWLNRLSF